MSTSAIEWTDRVWNPVTGCDRVSPGCANCYALTYAARLKAMGQPKYQRDGGRASGPGFGLTLHEDVLGDPLRWRKPVRVFVNSMSDLFHEEVPFGFIDRVFETMVAAERHTFQVLTKRPERMREYLSQIEGCTPLGDQLGSNIWLGTSIENRRFVGRADALRDTPMGRALRFISAEPLLGPLIMDDREWSLEDGSCEPVWRDFYEGPDLDLDLIDWLIVGGESGPGHRPMREQWVRDLRDAAAGAGTAFFLKQASGPRPGTRGDLPDDLWAREFPRA